jgi:hypothetical protein
VQQKKINKLAYFNFCLDWEFELRSLSMPQTKLKSLGTQLGKRSNMRWPLKPLFLHEEFGKMQEEN